MIFTNADGRKIEELAKEEINRLRAALTPFAEAARKVLPVITNGDKRLSLSVPVEAWRTACELCPQKQ